MAMEDKKYLKYLESFTETKSDKTRNFPRISPYVKDYDYVEGSLAGYDEKWVARVGKMHLYRMLILELSKNPNSSYDICYTDEEMQGLVPGEFSAIIKRPNYWCEVDFDVFGSRVFNFFQIPTVFNRRFEALDDDGFYRNYVCSVSFLKKNEEFYDLVRVANLSTKFDFEKCSKNGLTVTLEKYGQNVEEFLKSKHINYSQDIIEEFKRFMAWSVAIRVCFLNDGDFRSANAGVVINPVLKVARPAPNHDFGELFDPDTRKDMSRYNMLREWGKLYPDDFKCFIDRLVEFVDSGNGRYSVCEKYATEFIREDHVRKVALDSIWENLQVIMEIAEEFSFGNENAKQ